jgi:hypothetical protein
VYRLFQDTDECVNSSSQVGLFPRPKVVEKLLEKVKEEILQRYQELFHHLGPAEQANLAGAINTLVRILEKAIHGEEREM